MKYINALFFVVVLLFASQATAQTNGTQGVEIENLEAVNTEYEDFAPMPYGNKLMLTQRGILQKAPNSRAM